MHKVYPVNKIDFLHVCKIYAAKDCVNLMEISSFFSVISCVTQIERISFISYKIFLRKCRERQSKTIE